MDDFTEKLQRLMSDQDLRIRLGRQAAEDMKPFAPEKVAHQWETLIQDTVQLIHHKETGREAR